MVQSDSSHKIPVDYSIWISKINGSTVTTDGKEKLGILHYKKSAIPVKWQATSRTITKNIPKRSIIGTLREERTRNHIKSTNKTREG